MLKLLVLGGPIVEELIALGGKLTHPLLFLSHFSS